MRLAIPCLLVLACDATITDVLPEDSGAPAPDPDMARWTANVVGEVGHEGLIGELAIEQRVGAQRFAGTLVVRGDAPGSVRPWHVHYGTCATSGVVVGSLDAYLPVVIGDDGHGTASARVAEALDDDHFYYVSVQTSPNDPANRVACGPLIAAP